MPSATLVSCVHEAVTEQRREHDGPTSYVYTAPREAGKKAEIEREVVEILSASDCQHGTLTTTGSNVSFNSLHCDVRRINVAWSPWQLTLRCRRSMRCITDTQVNQKTCCWICNSSSSTTYFTANGISRELRLKYAIIYIQLGTEMWFHFPLKIFIHQNE